MSAPISSVTAESRVPCRRLWFGFTAAAAAWLVHGFFSVLAATEACQGGRPGGARLLLALPTFVALVLAAAGGVVTYQNWRRLSAQPHLTRAEGRSREEFLALGGIVISIILFIGIIWGGLPLVLLDVCEAIR
jgi:hypothetical protein